MHLQQVCYQLVNLYSSLFLYHWYDFKSFMKQFSIDDDQPNARTYAARVSISAWIHDLYVSNRNAAFSGFYLWNF